MHGIQISLLARCVTEHHLALEITAACAGSLEANISKWCKWQCEKQRKWLPSAPVLSQIVPSLAELPLQLDCMVPETVWLCPVSLTSALLFMPMPLASVLVVSILCCFLMNCHLQLNLSLAELYLLTDQLGKRVPPFTELDTAAFCEKLTLMK